MISCRLMLKLTEAPRKSGSKDSIGNLRNESTEAELVELGIYVQEYELYIAKQMGEIIPILRSMPRIASSLGHELEDPSQTAENGEAELVPTLAAA
jgi:hypothetical protein